VAEDQGSAAGQTRLDCSGLGVGDGLVGTRHNSGSDGRIHSVDNERSIVGH
jgi:hypothetical protein